MDKDVSEKVYREKSIKKIDSPEKLDDYLKVTTPKVWIVLLAIIVLIVGFVVWAIFGVINTSTEIIHPIEFLIH